jgi:hypothetical protein
MHVLANAILCTWRRNRAYALRLVEGLDEPEWVAQPAGLTPGVVMNHPAWVLCHLALYASVAAPMARAEPFPDPLDHRYGMKSVPLVDRAAYPPGARIVEDYCRAHDDAERSLEVATDRIFALVNPIERQRAAQPSVGDMLVTLMVKHESMHLGQLSAWRRAMGLARVAM